MRTYTSSYKSTFNLLRGLSGFSVQLELGVQVVFRSSGQAGNNHDGRVEFPYITLYYPILPYNTLLYYPMLP